MNIRFASPLFIVREDCQKDLYSVLKRLAALGFEGIEFLGFFGHDAAEVRAMLEETHLAALGNHVPHAELCRDPEGVFAFHKAVGCEYLTVADLPLEDFPALVAFLDRLARLAREYGIRLLFHNHDGELIDKRDGVEVLDYLLSHTAPETLALEPDLGWIEIGGGSCEHYLKTYRDRCPVIHLKDYYCSDLAKVGRVRDYTPEKGGDAHGHFEFRPTGYGVVNLPKLMPLCLDCKPAWFVMDHDLAYGRDSYDDLKLSLDYVRALLSLQQ